MITSDFKGRELTAVAITVAAIGSAALNTWGAFHIFPNPLTGWVIAGVILACEVFVFLAPRHIIKDWDNRHFWKSRGAAVLLAVAIAACLYSGKQAFGVLFLEANHSHKVLDIRADAREAEAAQYHANILAGKLEDGITLATAEARWERMQTKADEARLSEMMAAPPPEIVVYILLILFEGLKIGGLYFVATNKTDKGLTWKQRRSARRREKLDRAKEDAAFEAKLAEAENVVPLAA